MSCDGPLGDSAWPGPSQPYITHYCVKKILRNGGRCQSYGLALAAQDPHDEASEEDQLEQIQQQLPKLPWTLWLNVTKEVCRVTGGKLQQDVVDHARIPIMVDVVAGGMFDAATRSRVRTLRSQTPSPDDGPHAEWMRHQIAHGVSMNAGVKSERPTNTMDTVMKRHQGELRVFEVPYCCIYCSKGTVELLATSRVYRNQLTALPAWFGNLSSLEPLTLGRNELQALPESPGNLKALTFSDSWYLHQHVRRARRRR